MRARGARVTDLVVLVVAADDGVMPQTKECLKLIREAGCQFVVAVTKCDLPQARTSHPHDPHYLSVAIRFQANVDKVKSELGAESVELEEFGGHVQLVPVAAPVGRGLEELQEALLLQVELSSRFPRMSNVSSHHVFFLCGRRQMLNWQYGQMFLQRPLWWKPTKTKDWAQWRR